MNDIFKFRVWDTVGECYCPRSHYILLSDGTLIEEIGGEDVICDSKNIELCTGLKDKNGKLIYEGDIFEADVLNSFDGDELIGKRIRGQVAYYTDGTCFTFARYAPFELGQIEIIGNIHENKELLGEKK